MLPTVCCVVVTDQDEKVLLIKRGKDPYINKWALISGVGYTKKNMTLEEGIFDEVEGDIATLPTNIKKLFSISSDSQDVVVFSVRVDKDKAVPVLPHVTEVKWVALYELTKYNDLAFDHQDILARYLSKQS